MDAKRKKYLLLAVGGLALAVIVAIVRARSAAQPVPTITVGYAPFVVLLPESGVVQYPQIQTLSSEISGRLGRIYVKAGDRVRAGHLIATIDNPAIVANAAGAAAAFRSATARAQSTAVTGSSNVVQAEANVEAARARLAAAGQDLANGVQSGLGYGETTAAEQQARADAELETASTALREANRLAVAYRNLYVNKAISRDQLDQAEAKLEQAQAAYEQTRVQRASLAAQLNRSRTVLEENLTSARQGLAQTRAALAAAQVEAGSGDVAAAQAEAARAAAAYAFAREQAEAMEIRAPYDATVLSVATEKGDPLRPLQPGDAIDMAEPIVILASQGAFVVRTRIDEQDVINVRVGQRATITGEDFPGHVLIGHVVEVAPFARASSSTGGTHTVAATIAIDSHPAFLRDGMSAEANIHSTDLPHALVVRNDAIGRDADGSYVYVVRDGRAHRQAVRVAASNETSSAIQAGLRPGDVIVAREPSGLSEGAAVWAAPVTASK